MLFTGFRRVQIQLFNVVEWSSKWRLVFTYWVNDRGEDGGIVTASIVMRSHIITNYNYTHLLYSNLFSSPCKC